MMGLLWRRFHRLHNNPGSKFRIGTKYNRGYYDLSNRQPGAKAALQSVYYKVKAKPNRLMATTPAYIWA